MKHIKPLAIVVSALMVFALGGALAPIQNVQGSPVMTGSGKAASMQDVQQAIVRAGAALGWQITPVKPGQLAGRLNLRTHQAIVDITHDAKQYNITYKDSVDLGAKDGQIHKNYHGWVQNLDRGIRAQLGTL